MSYYEFFSFDQFQLFSAMFEEIWLCRNHSPICYSTSEITPRNYKLTLVKPFSFV